MSTKPATVTWSAIVLGIITAFLACSALGLVLMAFIFAHNPGIVPPTPGSPAPPMGFIAGLFGVMAAFTLACVAWGATTTVGIVRLRNWARISIIVIGVCLAAISLLEVFGTFVSMLVVQNMAMPSGAQAPNPAIMRGVMLFMGFFWLAVAAVGVWWVVYFAKRTTRNLFHNATATLPLAGEVREACPITDFSVAQPLLAPTAAVPIENRPAITPPQGSAASPRPVSMTVIAILMFIGAANMLILCALPFPFFFFGMQMTGWHGHIVLIAMGTLYGFAACGLLRRSHLGWMAAVGLQIVGMVNCLIMLLPAVQDRQLAYMHSVMVSMTPAMPTTQATQAQAVMTESLMKAVMGPSIILGAGVGVLFLILLWRARWWYKPVSEY